MTQADFDRSQSIAKLVDKLHDGQHVYLQTKQVIHWRREMYRKREEETQISKKIIIIMKW